MVKYVSIKDVSLSVASGITKKKASRGKYNVYGSTGIIGYSNLYDYSGVKILVARVEAILRRANKYSANDTIEFEGIVVDKAAHQVTVDGKPIELSYKEFELLTYFVENAGIALSREKILNNVWNYDYFGDARTIDTHVKKLRSKLGDKGEYIKTVWGMGYKLEV